MGIILGADPDNSKKGVIMGRMRKSRLSRYKQERLIEHFIAGSTARTAGNLCAVNRKTAAFFFLRLREIIAYIPTAGGAVMGWMFRTFTTSESIHSKRFAHQHNPINGIDNCWNQAKRHRPNSIVFQSPNLGYV